LIDKTGQTLTLHR